MYLLLGKSHTERKEYEHAIQLFERARAHVQPYQNHLFLVVSLVGSLTGLAERVGISHLSSLTDVRLEV